MLNLYSPRQRENTAKSIANTFTLFLDYYSFFRIPKFLRVRTRDPFSRSNEIPIVAPIDIERTDRPALIARRFARDS